MRVHAKIGVGVLLLAAGPGAASTVAAETQPIELPALEIIAPSPAGGPGIDRDTVPGTVSSVTADDLERANSPSVIQALAQLVPGVSLGDSQGNDFFQDLYYHGFVASPLQGTSQGLAIYQNGIRVNEAFGDTVNWDLIPEIAIDRMDVWSSNPVFGLNALGGAINIQMKNGFTVQGLNATLQGGSYGRISGSIEYGMREGDFSLYIAADGAKDAGWRLQSASEIARLYADAGYRGDGLELHLVASGGRNSLGVVGPTPIQLTALNPDAIFTWPQTTANETGSLALNGTFQPTDAWTVVANIYGRNLDQKHVDGNDGNFEGCSSRSSYGGQLCLQDDDFGTPAGGKTTAFRNQFVILSPTGATIPFVAGAPYGTVDRTSTNTTTVGGSIQASNKGQLFGHDNNFIAGGSIDGSDIDFASNSQLGYIYPNLSVGPNLALPGSGAIIHTLGNLGYAPVGLTATTDYYGLYAVDSFNITPALAATVGLRVNIADIGARDTTGAAPELNGDNRYSRANPMAGLTYKIVPEVTVYGGYSEANRAPTPLEVDCADPVKPCLLENSLVSDPPLRQVVARTFEAGLRGKVDGLTWNAGLYRTESDNDIVALASVIQGRGYYTNVPETLRQGVDLDARYKAGPWMAYASYSYVDATYRFTGALASPNSPSADDNGNIQVRPGDRIPGIPAHQVKIGADYAVTEAWKIGGDFSYLGSQYYVGDDFNQNAKLPAYWTVNLRTSYQATENIQLFGQANNVFNRQYATYGTYFETDSVAGAIPTVLTDPRSVTLAQPISVYGGVKVSF